MGGTCAVRGGTGKAEAAKLPGAGIGPKQCPGKRAAEKGQLAQISENREEEHTCTIGAARTMRKVVICGRLRGYSGATDQCEMVVGAAGETSLPIASF